MVVDSLLVRHASAHDTELKDLAMLSIMPGSFSSDAAVAILRCRENSKADGELARFQKLQTLFPGALECHSNEEYSIHPDWAGPLALRLASQAELHKAAATGMIGYVADVVRPMHPAGAHPQRGPAQQRQMERALQLLAEGVVSSSDINAAQCGTLGDRLCWALDMLCVQLKCCPHAEAAIKKLLEEPHKACCPFCVFHLYPTLHAQGKVKEMQEYMELIPLRGVGPDNPLYEDVDVYHDYLTSLSYSLALQGRALEAEQMAARALWRSKVTWHRLNNYNNLVYALRQQGRLGEAQEAMKIARMLMEDQEARFKAEGLLAGGLVYRDLGQLERAEETLREAVETARQLTDSQDVDDMRMITRYHLAKVLLRMGDKVKAAGAVEMAAEARLVQASCCMAGNPFIPKLQVLMVDAVLALFTLA